MSQLPSVFELMVATNHNVQRNQVSHNGLETSDHRHQLLQPMQQQPHYSTTPQPQPLHFYPPYPCLTPHYTDTSRPYPTAPPIPPPFTVCHNTQHAVQQWHSDPTIPFERSPRTDGGPLSSPSSLYTEPQTYFPHNATNHHHYHHASSYPHAMRHSSIAPPLATHIEDQAQYWCPPLYHVQMLIHPQQLHQISADENPTLINKRRTQKQRSRTGCITCRKRHLKCDETKPRCQNCTRSHKVCLGYETSPRQPARLKLESVVVEVVDDALKMKCTNTDTLANDTGEKWFALLPIIYRNWGFGIYFIHSGRDQGSLKIHWPVGARCFEASHSHDVSFWLW